MGLGLFHGKGLSFLLLGWQWFLGGWSIHSGCEPIMLACACWVWSYSLGDKMVIRERLSNDGLDLKRKNWRGNFNNLFL